MKFQQSMMDYEISANCVLSIDFEARRLQFEADPELEIDETFDSLEAMDALYQAKIAPCLEDNECYDIDESRPVEIIAELSSFGAELAVRHKGEPIPKHAGPYAATPSVAGTRSGSDRDLDRFALV